MLLSSGVKRSHFSEGSRGVTKDLLSPTQHKASFKVTISVYVCNGMEYAIIHKTNSLSMERETFK